MARSATLYRMVLPDHVCPYGVHAKQLLQDAGYDVDEHLLQSREEVETFMEAQGIDTTPLILIDGKVIGGSDELARFLAADARGV